MHRNRESIGINGQVKRRSPFSRINGHTPIGLAAWVGVALAPAAIAQVQAVPGYSYTKPHQQAGVAGMHEYTRGADLGEDGLVWSITGTGATTDGLKECNGATFTVRAYTPQQPGVNDVRTLAINTRCTTFGGVYCPDKFWPNDLACDDPTNRNAFPCIGGSANSYAVAVGGWLTSVPPSNAFESANQSNPMPTCVEPNATHAWLYVAGVNRLRATYGFNQPMTPDDFITTFVALDSSSSVELVTVDSVPYEYFVCPSSPPFDQSTSLGAFAAGGNFQGHVQFRGPCTQPQTPGPSIEKMGFGGTDAFVSIHNQVGDLAGSIDPVLHIGSPGDDGILGISIDHQTGKIVVCGYYGASSFKYDPGDPTKMLSCAGGRDFFVASYTYGVAGWSFNWIYNYGTAADEQAEGVWADVSGMVYAVGHRNSGGASSLLRVKLDTTCAPSTICFVPWGMQVYTPNEGSIKGLDVCVDGIGRPVMTGSFSGTVAFPAATGYTAATLTSAGDTDGFTARLDPDNGQVQWAFKAGGTGRDTSTDVNVCQFNSARLVHGGDFSATANFNPLGGSPLTPSAVDGYTNILDHMPEGGSSVKRHITVLLDHTPDYAASLQGDDPQQLDWDFVVQKLAALIEDPANDWDDGRLSMRVVLYHAGQIFNYHHPAADPSSGNGSREFALQAIPVVTLTSNREARWFADRLRWLTWHRRWENDPNELERDKALRLAGDPFGFAGGNAIYPVYASHADYRHVWMPLHAFEPAGTFTTASVRDAVTGFNPPVTDPYIDQINTMAVRYVPGVNYGTSPSNPFLPGYGVERAHVRDQATDSKVRISPAVQLEANIGMAAEAKDVVGASPWLTPEYTAKLARMFLRMTVCPADYNRNGTVQGIFGAGADWQDFDDFYGSGTPYTDWNFDDQYLGKTASDADGAKFDYSFDAGCP